MQSSCLFQRLSKLIHVFLNAFRLSCALCIISCCTYSSNTKSASVHGPQFQGTAGRHAGCSASPCVHPSACIAAARRGQLSPAEAWGLGRPFCGCSSAVSSASSSLSLKSSAKPSTSAAFQFLAGFFCWLAGIGLPVATSKMKICLVDDNEYSRRQIGTHRTPQTPGQTCVQPLHL